MTTLLSVVKDVLANNGKVLDDILWFGTEMYVWGERSDVEEDFDIEYGTAKRLMQMYPQFIVVGDGWQIVNIIGGYDHLVVFVTSDLPKKPERKIPTSKWKSSFAKYC